MRVICTQQASEFLQSRSATEQWGIRDAMKIVRDNFDYDALTAVHRSIKYIELVGLEFYFCYVPLLNTIDVLLIAPIAELPIATRAHLSAIDAAEDYKGVYFAKTIDDQIGMVESSDLGETPSNLPAVPLSYAYSNSPYGVDIKQIEIALMKLFPALGIDPTRMARTIQCLTFWQNCLAESEQKTVFKGICPTSDDLWQIVSLDDKNVRNLLRAAYPSLFRDESAFGSVFASLSNVTGRRAKNPFVSVYERWSETRSMYFGNR